jgi:hypothetical protein
MLLFWENTQRFGGFFTHKNLKIYALKSENTFSFLGLRVHVFFRMLCTMDGPERKSPTMTGYNWLKLSRTISKPSTLLTSKIVQRANLVCLVYK